SSHLWTTHQLDAFRTAALAYADRLRAVAPPEPPPAPRLGVTVIGQGVAAHDEPLFRKLRAQGAYFSGVKPENGLDLLLNAVAAVLDRFQVKLLTEGSGTQIFSTTFAQWTAREALRRAQPLTLLVRFAPRQRQKPMNEMLSASREVADLDPLGSLIDADMGA